MEWRQVAERTAAFSVTLTHDEQDVPIARGTLVAAEGVVEFGEGLELKE